MALSTPKSYAELKALADAMQAAGFDSTLNASFDTILSEVAATEAARASGASAYDVQQLEEKAMSGISKAVAKSNKSYNDTLSDLQTKVANLANANDTSGLSATEAAKVTSANTARAATVAQDIKDFNANFAGLQPAYTEPVLVRNANGYLEQVDAQGNVKSAAIAGSDAASTGATGRLGEGTRNRLSSDGKTWEVYGVTSGKVYQSGLADASAAEKWANQNQSGGSADATGAFSTDSSGTSLWNGLDLNGLTEDQVAAVRDTYLNSSTDTSLATKTTVTDADTQSYLEKAASESDPYYNQIYSRGLEDYQRGLDYKASVRTDEIAREQLNAQVALENSQSANADAGLAFSGIRKKAEDRLAEQADNIARASRRDFNEQVTQYGRSAEDTYGSSNLTSATIPQIDGTDIYTPAGNITGSVQRDQTTANQTEADRLSGNAAITDLSVLDQSDPGTANTDLSQYYN